MPRSAASVERRERRVEVGGGGAQRLEIGGADTVGHGRARRDPTDVDGVRGRWQDDAIMTTWTNWAGTVSAEVTVAAPATVRELAEVVAAAAARGQRVKPVGAGHSFTSIGVHGRHPAAAGPDAGDRRAPTAPPALVTVLAGTRLHALNEALWQLGLSMTNLGDIDVQTISGAISTGTHGTGAKLGGLATQVRALDLVLADGSSCTCSAEQNPDLFAAARVGLGALGVIATVTLQCEPAFALAAAEAPGRARRRC